MSQPDRETTQPLIRRCAVAVLLIASVILGSAQASLKAPLREKKLPSKRAGGATRQPSEATVTKPQTGAAVSNRAATHSSLEGTTWIATVYWFDYSSAGPPPSNRIIEVDKFKFKFLRGGKFEGGVTDHTTSIDGTWIQHANSVTVKDPNPHPSTWKLPFSKIVATINGNRMTGRGTRYDNQQFRFKAIKQ